MRIRFLRLFLVIAPLLAGSAAIADDLDGAFADRDDLLKLPVTPGVVVMCHGFNCLFRDEVAFSAKDIAEIQKLMHPGKPAPKAPAGKKSAAKDSDDAAQAAAERLAIGKVMAWLDRRVGSQLGTVGHVSQAGFAHSGQRGQFDCIDTTHNTTLMLRQLIAMGLIVHHRVTEPASRFDPHTTAVIYEGATGTHWVVDGWTRGYGEVPDIMPLSAWMKASPPALSAPAARSVPLGWAQPPADQVAP